VATVAVVQIPLKQNCVWLLEVLNSQNLGKARKYCISMLFPKRNLMSLKVLDNPCSGKASLFWWATNDLAVNCTYHKRIRRRVRVAGGPAAEFRNLVACRACRSGDLGEFNACNARDNSCTQTKNPQLSMCKESKITPKHHKK
jgi:hypothetical protein